MLRTLQTASEAMHREQTRVDTLANNLANAATTGFRQVLTRVAESAPGPPDAAGPGEVDAAPPGPAAGEVAWLPRRDLEMTEILDPRPGPLRPTGRDTDIAVQGRGFLVVQDAQGEEFYTRDGALQLDPGGRLITSTGSLVLGEGGPINAAGGPISIARDGTVNVGGQARGRLRLVDFEAPQELAPRGDGLLAAGADAVARPVEAGDATILQGHLEGSNVDPVRTLVDMIAAQRAFEIGTKVLQANDQMLGKSVNSFQAR